MTRHTDFRGVYPAITTPFREDDRIDVDCLRENAQRLEEAGVSGLVPVGTTGESATLTHDEHVHVVETVVDAVSIPVIAGTGSNSTREAIELAGRSADAGADSLLLISPYYNKPEPAGMEAHFEAIADAVDLPQIVYNVPGRTGRSIAVDSVVDLASHENVRGYKAASGDLGRVGEIVERTQTEEFDVLSGEDALTLPSLSLGARGTISVVANVEPERTVAMVEAALEGEFDRARALHCELGPLMRALFWETNPIPVKEALHLRGLAPARMRSPLSRLSADRREALEAILADLDDSGDAETDAGHGTDEGTPETTEPAPER
ncbi:4-hydroxy-tetrahydrodipicolinate synthase [Halobacteriales archaeon QS_3_64_16]|nr:MAG: 4-hydroxy-tetrahydrodipicolinate synthase [Halobacteriales archaeon QS_3_64_16]